MPSNNKGYNKANVNKGNNQKYLRHIMSSDPFNPKTIDLSDPVQVQDQKIIDAIKVVHPKYKWIARDESGTLCAYKSKPDKGNSSWFTSYDFTWLDDEHLQFIQWTDKEPYCIGD